jgi:biopolymer transport protein ExbD
MPRKIHKSRSSPASLDMTPMIDVVFQLMIFFIVTMKITKDFNQDVKMQLTRNSPLLKDEPGPLVVEIDRRGILSSHNAHMDRETFRRILKGRYDRMGAFPVLIRADKRTRHQDVRAVMDICSETGIWELTFVGIKEKKTAD